MTYIINNDRNHNKINRALDDKYKKHFTSEANFRDLLRAENIGNRRVSGKPVSIVRIREYASQ